MTDDRWTHHLSSYLDDDLPRGERLELERHLLDCESCRRTLDQLRAVVAQAAALGPTDAPAGLWPTIARHIAPVAAPRHVRVPLGAAIAAGVLLTLTSSVSAWLLLHRPGPAAEAATVEQPAMPRPASMASVPYGHAVDDLMMTLQSRKGQLNPKTVQVIEHSLATIDQAIADAVAVLRDHPDDMALVQRVSEQRRMKLAVLRQVERLTVAPEN